MSNHTEIPVEVGDVFTNSWGYDQTNVDFYVVRSVTRSGKSARIQQVPTATVEDRGAAGAKVVPVVDEPLTRRVFGEWEQNDDGTWRQPEQIGVEEAPILTKRINRFAGDFRPGEPYLSMDHGSCTLWDGDPESATSVGFGH